MRKEKWTTWLRVLCVFLVLLAGSCPVTQARQAPVSLAHYTQERFTAVLQPAKGSKEFYAETTPWVLTYQTRRHYFLTTHFSALWRTQESLALPQNQQLWVKETAGDQLQWVSSSGHWWGRFISPKKLERANLPQGHIWREQPWARSYNGVFSAHVVTPSSAAHPLLFAVSHGENKNEKLQDHFYQNSVRPQFRIDPQDPATYSGGNPYQDCWQAYFGFLNGSWLALDSTGKIPATRLQDIGPIAWPSNGYVTARGEQASTGLRHPSSLLAEKYLYIFVQEGGTKLIRVHQDSLRMPGAYTTWSRPKPQEPGFWVPSLPQGFTKEKAATFFAEKGPANTPVFALDQNTVRFAVARFKNPEDGFIGVEDYLTATGTAHTAFRFSKDLVNWSDRQEFFRDSNWASHQLKYPIFLNKAGTSNTVIDKDEFYVIGMAGTNQLTKIRFRLAPDTAEAPPKAVIFQPSPAVPLPRGLPFSFEQAKGLW